MEATQEKKGRLATCATFYAPTAKLLLKSDGHALRFIGAGNLELFQQFFISSSAIPPNTSVGYAALIIDLDANDSRWDIVRERDG